MMMPDKDPSAFAAFARWGDLALSFGLAAFFGLIRYLQEFLNPDSPTAFKWLIATAKGFTAGAVGILTHWLVAEWEVRPNLAAFLIAVAGFGGAETIELFRQALKDMVLRWVGGQKPNE